MNSNTNSTPDTQLKWIPIFGEFDAVGNEVRYRGKRVPIPESQSSAASDAKDQPGVGLILSSLSLADGKVYAEVEFDRVTPDSICELAVAYDPNALHIVTAGLGGSPWAMFGIREYRDQRMSGMGWSEYRVGGDRANLKPSESYSIEAHFEGALVTLNINGVNVGSAEVSSPLGRARQIGLLCKGDHDIAVRNFRVDGEKPRAFVVMQFSSDYDDVYRDVVKEVCKDFEVNVLRADEVGGPGLIIGDIIREIGASQLIIADVTPPNPNVYFEIGYALARGKPTILLARKGTSLPFDIAGYRVLFYEDTIGGKKRLEDGLRRHLDAIISV